MTIKDCIDVVDNSKPNQYSVKDKVMWLSDLDETIINDVIKTHEGYDGRYDLFEGYSEDKLTTTLVVRSPHDRLYVAYLKMMIDKENGETQRYNASASVYNGYYMEFRKYYNKTHLPLTRGMNSLSKPINKRPGEGLTDAQYENLKRDLTFILQEHFADTISPDKVYDVVTRFTQDNMELLKGKDGKSLTYDDLSEANKEDMLKDVYKKYVIDNLLDSLKEDIKASESKAKDEIRKGIEAVIVQEIGNDATKVMSQQAINYQIGLIEATCKFLSKNKASVSSVYTKAETNKQIKSSNRYTYYTPSAGLVIENGTVVGIGTCRDEHIVIPELYNDGGVKKPVTAVRAGTFSELLGSDGAFIKSITFPSSIERFIIPGNDADNIINSDYCPNLSEIHMMNPNITWDDVRHPFRLLETVKDLYFAFTEKQYDNINAGKWYTLITLKNENIAAGIVPTKHFGHFVTSAVIGDIDKALDSILTIQESIVGGVE